MCARDKGNKRIMYLMGKKKLLDARNWMCEDHEMIVDLECLRDRIEAIVFGMK